MNEYGRFLVFLPPASKCNFGFALIFLTLLFCLYYSQVNAILPLANGQNRGKYAKTKGQCLSRSGCRQVRAGPIDCNRYPAKNLSKHLLQPAFCKWASNIQPTKPSGFCRPALFSLPCASRARADEETHRHRGLRAAPSLPPAVRPPPRSLRQCRAPQNPLHKRLKNPHHHHASGGNRQAPQ